MKGRGGNFFYQNYTPLKENDFQENDPDDPDTIGSEDEDEELVEDIGDAEGTSEAGGKGEIKSLKIIQLGTINHLRINML